MQKASQYLNEGDPRALGLSSVANHSSVDGQDTFRNDSNDHLPINYFQSLERFSEQGLPL